MVKTKLKNKYLSQLRKRWAREKWDKHKDEITMTDLADIFGVSVVMMFKILKREEVETK
jgi:hypothetical protein|tara:strand:- start:1612 stop:1788 length:177 start_codon:yes stop_codon:yes gene_type:complete